MPDPLVSPAILPMGEDDSPNSFDAWKARATASRDQTLRYKVEWDKNSDRLLVKKPLTAYKDEVVVPKDYANTQQKLAQLAFQVPQIHLELAEPGPLGDQADDPVQIFQAVINHELVAPGGVNAAAMIEETLMDALSVSGIFACKVHYENTIDGTKTVQTGQQPDPSFVPPVQPGNILNLQPTQVPPMVPVYATVPNLVSEHYRMDRISPAKLLWPEEFTQSDYDRSPWLGFDFVRDFTPAVKAQFGLPDDFRGFVAQDEQLIGSADKTTPVGGAQKRIKGSEIWYFASLYDETVKHPDLLRQLVIIDGLDRPAIHRDSPYQQIDPDGTIRGMIGNPIHVGALRYIPDTACPPSDTQMSRFQVEELSKGRTQMVRQRERNVPLRVAPIGLGEEFFAKVEKNLWGAIIPLADEHFADPNGPVKEIAPARFPRENFSFDDIAKRDIAETWALDINQLGVSNEKKATATEVATVQANANVRLRKERNKYLDWFARGAAKLGSLIQLFADDSAYVRLLGPDGARRLVAWDKTKIQGRYLFTVKPNSAVFLDEADRLRVKLQQYNLLINSPYVDGMKLTTDLIREMDLDPAGIVRQPQPKPAEVPKISFAFNGNDLNPNNPVSPIVYEILRQGGIQVDDQAMGAAQRAASVQGPTASMVPHGTPQAPPPARTVGIGPGPRGGSVEPLNKHQMDESGARPGPKPVQPGQVVA